MPNNQNTFPLRIFSSFFVPYFSSQKDPNVSNISVEIWQLCTLSEAKKNMKRPFLRWVTLCDQEFQKIFKKIPKIEADSEKLWEFSVSEVFFAHPTSPHYLECEMTPYGHHLILQFENIRKRKQAPFIHHISTFNECTQINENVKFGMELSLQDLIEYLDNNTIKIQCALSLGDERYLLAPGWTQNDDTEKADFHQPDKFWTLTLIET